MANIHVVVSSPTGTWTDSVIIMDHVFIVAEKEKNLLMTFKRTFKGFSITFTLDVVESAEHL